MEKFVFKRRNASFDSLLDGMSLASLYYSKQGAAGHEMNEKAF